MSRPASRPSTWTLVLLVALARDARAQGPGPVPPPAPTLEQRVREPVEPPPGRPLVSAQEHRLRELEEQTRMLREEVRKQLADPVADVELAAKVAEKDWREAVLHHERLQNQAKEYEQGALPQEVEAAKGEIALANADLDRARERLAYWNDRKSRGERISLNQLKAEELSVERARFDVEQAETRLDVLTKYEGPKETRRLQAAAQEAADAATIKELAYQTRAGQLDRRRALVGRLKSATPEDLVVSLLEEVVAKEARVAELAREARALGERPAGDPGVADQLRDKQAQIRSEAEQIKTNLADAVAVADEASALRRRLFRAEKQLLFERRAPDNPPK